jgi:hypothetical protein
MAKHEANAPLVSRGLLPSSPRSPHVRADTNPIDRVDRVDPSKSPTTFERPIIVRFILSDPRR